MFIAQVENNAKVQFQASTFSFNFFVDLQSGPVASSPHNDESEGEQMATKAAKNLPEICAIYHEGTDEPILIKRGFEGYFPGYAGLWPEEFNGLLGLDEYDIEAMIIGSMNGWDVPGAYVEHLRAQNRPAHPWALRALGIEAAATD